MLVWRGLVGEDIFPLEFFGEAGGETLLAFPFILGAKNCGDPGLGEGVLGDPGFGDPGFDDPGLGLGKNVNYRFAGDFICD